MLSQFILPGISLGLSAVAVPGPLQAFLINITLRYGWRRGLLVVLSPLLTDVPIIAVVVFLLGQLPDTAIQLIRIMGGLLLLWIARGANLQYRAGANFAAKDDKTSLDNGNPGRILITGMMMNFVSPGPYLFWGTVNGPLLLEALEQSLLHAGAFLLAFYGTFLGGMALLVLVFDRVGKINPQITRTLLLVTTLLLIWFSTVLLTEALSNAPALADFGITSLLMRVVIACGLALFIWLSARLQSRTA